MIGRSAAVRLLVARARQVRPDFAVTSDNAAAVAELCRRLDGIPLALELAAAQLRLLTPATLLRRLGTGLDRSLDLAASAVDTPDRQRTLRATIQWSYSLLGEAERALLARLSVFTGSWTVEASDAVGTVDGDLDAVDILASLLSQSLGPAAFAAATAAGGRMRIPDALRYGLAATAAQTTSDPFPDWVSGLRPPEPVATGRLGL
jgi:predicted ATPase